MWEEIEKNSKSISEPVTVAIAENRMFPLILVDSGLHEVKAIRLGDTVLEELIGCTKRTEAALVANRCPIEKDGRNFVNVAILTAVLFSDTEPGKKTRKISVTGSDQDISKPWYFTHV